MLFTFYVYFCYLFIYSFIYLFIIIVVVLFFPLLAIAIFIQCAGTICSPGKGVSADLCINSLSFSLCCLCLYDMVGVGVVADCLFLHIGSISSYSIPDVLFGRLKVCLLHLFFIISLFMR